MGSINLEVEAQENPFALDLDQVGRGLEKRLDELMDDRNALINLNNLKENIKSLEEDIKRHEDTISNLKHATKEARSLIYVEVSEKIHGSKK